MVVMCPIKCLFCVAWSLESVLCEVFILCYVKVLYFVMCITITNGLAALRRARFASVQRPHSMHSFSFSITYGFEGRSFSFSQLFLLGAAPVF